MSLLYSNKTSDDILCKAELDSLQKFNPHFTAHYTLTKHDKKKHGIRAGLEGRIGREMLKKLNFTNKPEPSTLVIVCGPPKFESDMIKLFTFNGFE